MIKSNEMGNTEGRMGYFVHEKNTEGILAGLPQKLVGTFDFDELKLEENKPAKQVTLYFRQGAKYVFHVQLIRKSGRCLVEMGGLDPAKVLSGIGVCRQHFDQWFQISSSDVKRFEHQDL